MSIEISPTVSQLIATVFASGRYPDQDALLTEAVRLLDERDRLRDQLDAGSQQLASGHYTDYDSAALRARFDDLKAGKRFRPQ
jgi:Arc/MetJ-type ribon-helix-helix transcriptional regulator